MDKKNVLLILITIVVTIALANVAEADAHPPWMIVERKTSYGIGRKGLPEYSIKGRTLQGQRWEIFTYNTADFESVDPGLVYRCDNGSTGHRWCPEEMIVRMGVIYVPLIHKPCVDRSQCHN